VSVQTPVFVPQMPPSQWDSIPSPNPPLPHMSSSRTDYRLSVPPHLSNKSGGGGGGSSDSRRSRQDGDKEEEDGEEGEDDGEIGSSRVRNP